MGGGGSVVRGTGPRGQQLYSKCAREPRAPSEGQPEGEEELKSLLLKVKEE